jgi:hypothetical protein
VTPQPALAGAGHASHRRPGTGGHQP